MTHRVLVCDDEELIRWSLQEHLTKEGYTVTEAEDGTQGLERVSEDAPDALILDLKMPGMGGLELLRRIRADGNGCIVIVITAHGGIESAIEATQLGADGYLAKPFDLREVSLKLQEAFHKRRLQNEVHYLREASRTQYGNLVGQSPAMQKVFDTLAKLERVDAPTVLVMGESGTGKDLIARAIHGSGPRKNKAFMEIDCASLPKYLIEAALFGNEKGAFTDAKTQKKGLFETAAGGIVFLDELGEMPLDTQAKLLRALENKTFKRVGGVQNIKIDCAIIAATNRDLKREVDEGRFREDLFYRLNVIPIVVPPLRERAGDIPLLVSALMEKMNVEFNRNFEGATEEALACLDAYDWPGNVRELRNVLERALLLNYDDTVLELQHLPPEVVHSVRPSKGAPGHAFELPEEGVVLDEVERSLIDQALERCDGNQVQAAKLLGITRYALRYRMQKYEKAKARNG